MNFEAPWRESQREPLAMVARTRRRQGGSVIDCDGRVSRMRVWERMGGRRLKEMICLLFSYRKPSSQCENWFSHFFSLYSSCSNPTSAIFFGISGEIVKLLRYYFPLLPSELVSS
jgi:hypothetical protein